MEIQSPNSEDTHGEMHIPSENLLELENFKSEFTCMICLGVVIKPLMLKCCDHLICTQCMKMYIRSSDTTPRCPLCKHSLIYTIPNKILNRLYANLKVECTQCKSSQKMEEYFHHFFNECKTTEKRYCKKCCEVYCSTGEEHQCSVIVETKEPKLHEHNLKFTNLRKHVNYEKLGWICDYCEATYTPDEKSYHCKKCGLDICPICVFYVKDKSKAKNLHFHELALAKAVDWVCNVCKTQRATSYSWSCAACDFDVCLKCFWTDTCKQI
jgi:hypothetical protein